MRIAAACARSHGRASNAAWSAAMNRPAAPSAASIPRPIAVCACVPESQRITCHVAALSRALLSITLHAPDATAVRHTVPSLRRVPGRGAMAHSPSISGAALSSSVAIEQPSIPSGISPRRNR